MLVTPLGIELKGQTTPSYSRIKSKTKCGRTAGRIVHETVGHCEKQCPNGKVGDVAAWDAQVLRASPL